MISVIVVAVNAVYVHTSMNTDLAGLDTKLQVIQIWPRTTIDTFAAFNLAVAGLTGISLIAM